MEERNDMGRANFIVLLLAEFLAIAGFASSGPLLPSFLRELGIADDRMLRLWSGWANSLPAITLAIFAPLWGMVSDAWGRKPMLVRATFGGAAVIGLLSIVNAPWQLLLLRTIQGCFTGTVAAATVLVASTSPKKSLALRLGVLQAAVMAGNSAGPLLGGFVADLAGNRPVFLLTSALLAAAGILVAAVVRERFERRPLNLPRPGRLRQEADRPRPWTAVLPLFSVIFLFQCSLSTVSPILPLYIETLAPDAGFQRSISGAIIGISSVTGALAALFSGKLAERFGHGRTLLVCLLSAAVLCVFQSLARDWVTLLCLRAAEGALLGGTMPSLNAMICERVPPENQGAVFGLSTSVGQTGASLGPLVGSVFAWALGIRATYAATGVLLLSASAAVAPRGRKGRNGEKQA